MCSVEPSTLEFLIPGQPPSVNHMYRVARGSRRIVKETNVAAYQAMVTLIVRVEQRAKWAHDGQIRIRYWFKLGRDIDCDNALKALNDAIAIALGVDDRRFLPCVMEKTLGHKNPGIRVEISPITSPLPPATTSNSGL